MPIFVLECKNCGKVEEVFFLRSSGEEIKYRYCECGNPKWEKKPTVPGLVKLKTPFH